MYTDIEVEIFGLLGCVTGSYSGRLHRHCAKILMI